MLSYLISKLNTTAYKRLRAAQFFLAIAIFTCAALMPGDAVQINQSDLALHTLGNFLLLTSAWVAFGHRFNLHTLFALTLPYSLLMEYAQLFVPSRQLDAHDALANTAGLLLALLFCHCLIWIGKRYSRKHT